MRVAIIGTRKIDKKIIYKILSNVPAETTEIVSGGAKGVDKAAEKIAEILSLPMTIFTPDYNLYGKAAPLQRNIDIIEYADLVLAFWDGKSKGTKQAIASCISSNKKIKVITI